MMKPIEETMIWKVLHKSMSAVLMLCSVLLVTVIGLSVFMRFVLGSNLYGSNEILALLAIWLYWIGGGYGSYEDSHISADMTNLMIKSENVKHIVKVIVRAITAVISCVFAYWSIVEFAIPNIASNTYTTGLRIPYIASKISLTVGLCLMAIYSIYHLVREVVPYKNSSVVETEGEG